MVTVRFIEASGREVSVEAPLGEPLMFAARDAGVAGIIGECGGSAMCATCHCYVVALPGGPLPPVESAEADTIEFNAHDPRPESRLTCQITATPGLEGAVFRVATGR